MTSFNAYNQTTTLHDFNTNREIGVTLDGSPFHVYDDPNNSNVEFLELPNWRYKIVSFPMRNSYLQHKVVYFKHRRFIKIYIRDFEKDTIANYIDIAGIRCSYGDGDPLDIDDVPNYPKELISEELKQLLARLEFEDHTKLIATAVNYLCDKPQFLLFKEKK